MSPVFDPMLTRSHAGGAAFVSRDNTVVIGVQTRKGLLSLGPRLGDDDGAALAFGTSVPAPMAARPEAATHLDAALTGAGTGAETGARTSVATTRAI